MPSHSSQLSWPRFCSSSQNDLHSRSSSSRPPGGFLGFPYISCKCQDLATGIHDGFRSCGLKRKMKKNQLWPWSLKAKLGKLKLGKSQLWKIDHQPCTLSLSLESFVPLWFFVGNVSPLQHPFLECLETAKLIVNGYQPQSESLHLAHVHFVWIHKAWVASRSTSWCYLRIHSC